MSEDDSPLLKDGLEAENPLLETSLDSPPDIPMPSAKGPKLFPHLYKAQFGPNQKLQQKGTHEIPVLHPSLKEMQDFATYIEQIEKKGVHLEAGIVKIIPPVGWRNKAKPHLNYEDLDDMPIKRVLSSTIIQVTPESDGVYFQKSKHKTYSKNGTTVGGFMEKATSIQLSKKLNSLDDIVNNFWSNIDNANQRCSLYGADVEGTLFGEDLNEFNPNKLGTLIDLAKESGMQIPGVTTPYLYFGSHRTAFAWHAEDLDLYSLNYQHFGEPKVWYAIPSAASGRFERLCAQLYQPFGVTCHSFLRHKICLTRPDILEKHEIPYGCVAQYPGEFIVTFPKGYHMGFNVGFNCNEAINFAVSRWFGYALQAKICDCQPEMAVRMNLNELLSKYAEKDEYSEFFIREPTKATERRTTCVGMRDYFRDALPLTKRLLLFDSSFEDEVEYNEEQAQISPFCCVCQYFSPKTNCQLKGLIGTKSKSPCYTVPMMLSKMQQSSIGAYRPDRTFKTSFLPFPESPLRQCANCKIAVHANCYSFIEGFPKEEPLHKNLPPQIVKTGDTVQPQKMDIPLKPIRIKLPTKCLNDKNIEKEQSTSPVTTATTKPPKSVVIKQSSIKDLNLPQNGQSTTSKPQNNIYNKIMKRIRVETSNDTQNNDKQSTSISLVQIKQEPTNEDELIKKETKPITVINPIVVSKRNSTDKKVSSLSSSFTTPIKPLQQSNAEWLCDPCRTYTEESTRRPFVCCEFCCMRGGAMIKRRSPASNEIGFIHVVCAIMSRTTSILRNEDNELIAHSLAPMREYSGLKRTNKNVLPTADGKARLCATYTNHEKSLFCGNFNDNFCGLCKESLHEVLVKCEKCHLEGRKMEVYHPTCSRLLNFQLCGRMYPDVVVAICPVHFDLSNDPKTDLKVGDSVVHKLNDEVHSLAEIVFIGKVNMEIVLSFHGGYMECDKKQILECECKSLGCNGSHFPGYQVAVRNRGAIGVTLGIYRGYKLEQTYRIRHDDGQSVTCDRSEFFSLKDPNCPNEFKRLLNKRRAEKDLLERMNVPIKRERRTISGTGKEENSTLAEILKQIERSEQAANKTFISMKIKQEVEE